jgi:hypothetical protein
MHGQLGRAGLKNMGGGKGGEADGGAGRWPGLAETSKLLPIIFSIIYAFDHTPILTS